MNDTTEDAAAESGGGLLGAESDGELAALLALLSVNELGPNRLRALLSDAGTATQAVAALRAPLTRRAPLTQRAQRASPVPELVGLLGCIGVNFDKLHAWATMLRSIDGAALLAQHRASGIELETPAQLARHPLWREDPEPPLMLFRKGAPVHYRTRRVGIVGTRRCSGYGRTMAQRLGTALADANIAVVSGLASGIDSAAQDAALTAGGQVIGVVGSGLDVVYPPRSARLWNDIGQHGTLLSEYPMGTTPQKWHFPARNRLIAALSEVVIVVESGSTGGSFYTVDAAVERGVPVMAVPGPVTVNTSDGTNELIADGCAVVRDIGDVLMALDLMPVPVSDAMSEPAPDVARADSTTQHDSMGTTQHDSMGTALLEQLTAGPATIDELIGHLESEPPDLSASSTAVSANAQDLSLGAIALALDRLRRAGWVTESGGWWERVR